MSQSENWSDYWQSESAKGEVFVDKSGNKHPELALFWKQLFHNFQGADRIIDLAQGQALSLTQSIIRNFLHCMLLISRTLHLSDYNRIFLT